MTVTSRFTTPSTRAVDLAVDVVGDWLAGHGLFAVIFVSFVALCFWAWPRIDLRLRKWKAEFYRGVRAQLRARQRHGGGDPAPTPDEVISKMLPRRSFIVKAVTATVGIAAGTPLIKESVFGYTLEGRLDSAGKNQLPISIACISLSTGETVGCSSTDDSGHFEIRDLVCDSYSIFAYRWRDNGGPAEWLTITRTLSFFGGRDLGGLEFPKRAGQSIVYDPITFHSGSSSLNDIADGALTRIKLELAGLSNGLLVVEGRTSDAAGTDGRYDNYGLACKRCKAVIEFLGPVARRFIVVSVPQIPTPRLVAASQVSDVEIQRADPSKSVRIVVLSQQV